VSTVATPPLRLLSEPMTEQPAARPAAGHAAALAEAALLVLAAASAALCLSGTESVARPLILLCAATLVPGGAILTLLPARNALEAVGLAVVLGGSLLTTVALAMIWTGFWHPTAAAAAVGALAAALLIVDLARRIRHYRSEVTVGAVAPVEWRRVLARTTRVVLLSTPALLILVLWRISLVGVDAYNLGSYGLPPALPPAWYVALALAIGGAVAAIWWRRGNPVVMTAYILAAAIILFATVPVITGQPHYAWVYKHIGVVRLFEQHGRVDLGADIYNRWPGFFALVAMLSPVAGRANPVTYAGWADVFFLVLDATLVGAVVLTMIRSARVAATAALFFVLTDWVGQTYFSPQAFGFALGIGVFLIMVSRLQSREGIYAERLFRLVEAVGRTPQEHPTSTVKGDWPRWAAIAVVLWVFGVVVASHQLTPYILLAAAALLMLIGMVRPWWLLVVMAVMTLGYLWPNLGFVQSHYGLFTSIDPFNNAQGLDITPNTPLPGKVFNTHAQLVLIALMWGCGALAAWRLLRRGLLVRAFPLLIGAAIPFVVIFGQSYGGEAPLRIVMFSGPWTCALIAWALYTVEAVRVRLALAASLAVVFGALFVPAYLGQEELNLISPAELRASTWFYRHGRPDSVLVLAAPGFPYRYGSSYTEFSGPEGDANPNLMTEPNFQSRELGPAQVPAVIGRINTYAKHGYVAFSTNEERYAQTFNIVPPGAIANLESAVAESPDFRLWYRNPDVRIYELVGGEAAEGAG
jgi:hypothetical protein